MKSKRQDMFYNTEEKDILKQQQQTRIISVTSDVDTV